MKYLVAPIIVLGVGTAALAQAAPLPAAKASGSYPPCSRTVTDQCVNPSQAPHRAAAHKGQVTHHATHRSAKHEASGTH